MHIAFLTPEFPHEKLGHSAGLGTSIYGMSLGLIKAGVKVSIIVYSQESDTSFEYKGLKIHTLRHVKYPYFGWYFYRKKIQRFVNELTEKHQVDLIEAPDWTGITAFIKFKVPHVIRLHGSDTYFCNLENRPVKKKNFFFEKKALQRAKALVSVSRFVGNETLKLFDLQREYTVIPNGIDVKSFTNENPNKFKKNNILYFGTVIRKKGVLELAKIFNEVISIVPEATLTIIGKDAFDIKTGNTSTFDLMKSVFSSSAFKRVNFLGKMPYESVKEQIESAHVCVFPSLAESFGMVTIEAMAMKKVVVNSNYGWAKEIIAHGVDGILEDPMNTIAYAKAVCSVLLDNIDFNRMTESAREKVKNEFDMLLLSELNIAFYQKVIKNTNAGS
jgi:glycosyltransferase involved in cell wall biosynthesis